MSDSNSRDDLLTEMVDEYLLALRQGGDTSRESFCAR